MLLVFVLLLAPALAPAAMAENRVALVVGNSAYKNVTPLDNPKNDARLMAATLRELGFALTGGDAQLDLDKSSFDQVVQDFGRQLQGAEVGLFYYAGHGVQVRGSNYLVPVSANPTRESDVDFQLLDANLILRQMEGAGTRLNVIVLDACRNNPFGGRGLRATSSGLAQMQAPQGTMISFATQPGNVAQDGEGGNSPYTAALARTIKRPGLGLFDAFNEIGLQVKQATGGVQQPWISSSPISGTFHFAGTITIGNAAAPSSSPPPSRDPAADAWAEIRTTNNTTVLEEFVRRFGDSFYATLARARLDELKKAKVAVVAPPAPPASATRSEPIDGWTKVCNASGPKQICVTGKARRVEGKPGEFEWLVALIDKPGNPLLRIGVPFPVQIQYGSRVSIDKLPPVQAPYFSCYASLCYSDHKLDQSSATALKQGGVLNIQFIKLDGKAQTVPVSISDFGPAYRMSPTVADFGEEKGILSAIAGEPVSEGGSLTPESRAKLNFSPWAKFCGKGREANAKQVCFTGRDARTGTGAVVVAAALIDPEGGPKKLLRITLPTPLRLEHGVRVTVDQNQPLTNPFFACFVNGCMADFEGTPTLVSRLKTGKTLTLQAFGLAGDALSFSLPLADFAKTSEGPPIDPKVYEEQQKRR